MTVQRHRLQSSGHCIANGCWHAAASCSIVGTGALGTDTFENLLARCSGYAGIRVVFPLALGSPSADTLVPQQRFYSHGCCETTTPGTSYSLYGSGYPESNAKFLDLIISSPPVVNEPLQPPPLPPSPLLPPLLPSPPPP